MHDKDNNIKNGDFDQKSNPDKSSRPSPTNDFGTQNSIEDMLFNILNDTASPEEFSTFKEWIKDDSHEKYFQQFKQLWNATTHASISAQEKAKALSKIHFIDATRETPQLSSPNSQICSDHHFFSIYRVLSCHSTGIARTAITFRTNTTFPISYTYTCRWFDN